MKNIFLTLGATGGVGYAFTRELISRQIPSTILVRNREKAIKLFGNSEYLEIVEGDITNSNILHKISGGKKFIFFGINFPYQDWESKFKPSLETVINASKESRATILFPENNYAFGNTSSPISEITEPVPTTKKGLIRLELVKLLKAASQHGDCKAVVLRLPDFFGPNVTNGLIKPIFENAIHQKPMQWIINADIPHQFAFTPDVAAVFYQLTQVKELPDFYLLNYGGEVISSIKEFGINVSKCTNGPSEIKVLPKFVLNLIGLVSPEVKSLKENFYQFENSIVLDDTTFNKTFPDFKKTPMQDAIKATVDWYRQHHSISKLKADQIYVTKS
ncbi:MAG: NAD(P)H-binding protein [Bacteroidetes bacterium]|nr:NAD(P)H-binding protein [Bacteroidota bacterium]